MADEVISQPGGAGTSKEDGGTRQSDDRTKPGFEPKQEEQDAVKGWKERVVRARDNPERTQWVKDLPEWRSYVAGSGHKDKNNQKLTRTNMVFATIAAAIPEIYAKNPDIGVTPTDAVPEAQMGNVKKFAQTAEKVVHKMLVEEGRLKKRSKANIRSTANTSIGVLKMTYQSEYRGDPLIINRIEDTQDNLARVEALIKALKKEDDPTTLAQKRDTLDGNLKALKAHNEVRIFKGFAVDRLKSEDFLILDEAIVEFDEYVDARALDQQTWMTVDQAKTLFQMEMTGATKYARPRADEKGTAQPGSTTSTPAGEMFVCVHEMWDKEGGVVRTWVEGMNRWAREPYAPKHVPQRWYPFYVLGFNIIEGRWRPNADVEMLMGLQDEYNTTRTNYADVRKKAVPKTLFRKGGNLSEGDVKNIMNSDNLDYIAVEGNPATPISQDVMRLDGPKIDPQAYDVTVIRNDMDLVVGRSDASRANLIKPKTATEAEIMQEAMSTRTAERRDTNEDLMSEMGSAALEIALNDLTKPEVVTLAGEDCEWPAAPESIEQIFRQVIVRVRAGSTGKPNQAQERDSWSKLLPQINDTMQKVAELRVQGMYDQADALIELLRETLRRFDEHLDLDAIIPPVKKDANGQPVAQQQAAAELMRAKQQLQQLQEELAKCQQDLQQSKAGEQAKVAQIEADKVLAQQEADNKARMESEAATRETAQQGAEAMRQHEATLAEEATKQQQASAEAARTQADDAKHQREVDAKLELDKQAAILKAATTILSAQISAAAAARTKDAEAQNAAEQEAFSSERMSTIIADLQKTMDGLGKSFDGMLKESQGRTKMIGQHLDALSQ